MSTKSTPASDSKRRTTTMNDVTDTHNGSTLELISYQADSRFDYENVNAGYCEGISLSISFTELWNLRHYSEH